MNRSISEPASEPRQIAATGSRRRSRWMEVATVIVLVASGVLGMRSQWSSPHGPVAARVNGEPIYLDEITRELPTNLFESDLEQARRYRLDRAITRAETRQFLNAHQIKVTESEIDQSIAEMRKTPPSLGCPCCRYKSLDEFMNLNFYTMPELRADMRTELGIAHYVLSLWNKTYPTTKSRLALVAADRPQIQKDCARVWQIFFNTFQQQDAQASPADVDAQARAKAEAAWLRLRKGEPFASVARAVSEDQTSREAGGYLGAIDRSIYGERFEQTLATLKPGQFSRPFSSSYGYHIVKWEPIQDDALLAMKKEQFMRDTTVKVLDQLEQSAKIVKYNG